MAEQTTSSMPDLTIGAAALGSLGTAAEALGSIKNLIYSISSNPLLAPYAVAQLENQIGKVVVGLKKIAAEGEKTDKSLTRMLWNAVKSPDGLSALGSMALASSLRLATLRDQIEKTALSLYKITRSNAGTPGGAYGNALGLTKAQISQQIGYSREFADQFRNIYERLQNQVFRNPAQGNKQRLMETLTGLSLATGVDFGRAVGVIQDHMAAYGSTVEEAAAATDVVRDAWNRGDTAIGDLNENMEASVELLAEFGRQGMNIREAAKAMMETQHVAGQMGITTNNMLDIFRNMNQLGAVGEAGIQARLRVRGAVQVFGRSQKMQNIEEQTAGAGVDEKMFVLQHTDRVKYMQYMQELARRVIPMGANGQVNWQALANKSTQIKTEFGLGGQNLENMAQLAEAKDIQSMTNDQMKEYEKKVDDISHKSLPDFDSKLNAIVKSAGTWQDTVDGIFKSLGVMVEEFIGKTGIMVLGLAGAGATLAGIFFKIRQTVQLADAALRNLAGSANAAAGRPGGGTWDTGAGAGQYGDFMLRKKGKPGAGTTTGATLPMAAGGQKGTLRPGAVIGGYIANQIAEDLAPTGPAMNVVQGETEKLANYVPFGGIASRLGRVVGGLVAGLFGATPDQKAFSQDIYESILKEGTPEALRYAEDYKKRSQGMDVAQDEKYSVGGAISRAWTGEQMAGGGGPTVNNDIKVFLDSDQIAARVQQNITHNAQTTPTPK